MNEVTAANTNKPRMLFLSGPWDHLETVRKVGLVDPVSRLLAHHFDLITVSGDQNYGEVVEEHAPEMPSKASMLRRVARDPVGQAILFDLMIRLFLEHVVGVSLLTGRRAGW